MRALPPGCHRLRLDHSVLLSVVGESKETAALALEAFVTGRVAGSLLDEAVVLTWRLLMARYPDTLLPVLVQDNTVEVGEVMAQLPTDAMVSRSEIHGQLTREGGCRGESHGVINWWGGEHNC